MDFQAELEKLVGSEVALDDQTLVEPRFFVGPLVKEGEGFYSIVDKDDGAYTSFTTTFVSSIQGRGITMEGAGEPLNSGWDESDESRPEDDDAYDADGEMDGFTF